MARGTGEVIAPLIVYGILLTLLFVLVLAAAIVSLDLIGKEDERIL